jgi:hypothetical protein
MASLDCKVSALPPYVCFLFSYPRYADQEPYYNGQNYSNPYDAYHPQGDFVMRYRDISLFNY